MKMTNARPTLTLLIALLLAPLVFAQSFIPDRRINPDDFTVLMTVDAKLSDGLVAFQPGGQAKFYIRGWTNAAQRAQWEFFAPAAGEYEAAIVIQSNNRQPLRLDLDVAGKTLTASLSADAMRWWERIRLDGLVNLPAGNSTMTLRIGPADGASNFDAQVFSVELVRPAVRAELVKRALALRADTGWFQRARYGIMVHWTNQSMPLHGEPKSYDDAVAAFDVEAFADQMQRTGAGFVLFTTAHAFQYFPAPLASLDKILPGRTSRRDLVADLAEALSHRGIKLMLYYHLGAINDAEWMKASGFFDTDTAQFFGNWRAIISEAGTRYKDRLAGWWFDEGATVYYHRNAPWEALDRAAKAGNPQRLVGFNAWELVNPTQFHDFCTGEGCQEPRGFCGLLNPGGDGRYPRGTHAGLQASACLIAERDWGHFTRNDPLPAPKWTTSQVAALLKDFQACRNVPIFNLEITQDGNVSARTIGLLEQARRILETK